MRFCEFIELVKEEIEKLYGGEREIIVQDVLGNNGVECVGMSVKEQYEQKAPVICLDSYYKSFLEQEMTVGNVVKDIYNTLNECQISLLPDIVFSNFEAVRPRIVYRLVNYKHNKKLLEDIPHFIYYDLAIIFCVLIESNDNGCISMLIPYNDTVNYIELSEMVKSINETEVPMDEVLSDNIYLYKRETNTVSAVFKESGMSKREMYLKKENVKKSKESVAI